MDLGMNIIEPEVISAAHYQHFFHDEYQPCIRSKLYRFPYAYITIIFRLYRILKLKRK
jgi:hypothetical protein